MPAIECEIRVFTGPKKENVWVNVRNFTFAKKAGQGWEVIHYKNMKLFRERMDILSNHYGNPIVLPNVSDEIRKMLA